MKHYFPTRSPLFGRCSELQAVSEELLRESSRRSLTIYGPSGCGKTRLASEVCSRMALVFEEGVWFVSLAEVQCPEEISEAVLRARPFGIAGDGPVPQSKAKQGKLVLLDQFDHLARSGGAVLEEILAAETGLHILLTSRHAVALHDNQNYRLAPLPNSEKRNSCEMDAESPSFSLFCHRYAAASWPQGRDVRELPSAWNLCRAMGGNPLGLELGAGASAICGIDEMQSQYERYVGRTQVQKAIADQNQPLSFALEESYQVLNAPCQSALSALAAFRDDFSADDANAAFSLQDTESVLEFLERQALVARANCRTDAVPRYRILDSVREHALAQVSGDDRAAILEAHAQYFLDLAETEPEGERIDHANYGAAMTWFCKTENVALGIRFADALHSRWETVGAVQEERRWLRKLLAIPDTSVPTSLSERVKATLSSLEPTGAH